MKNNSEIVDAAKKLLGVDKDTELAKLIGSEKQNIQQARNAKSQTVTHKILVAVINEYNKNKRLNK
tara:strand:- start:1335 stop:1532 length:198 start_codon:yes stop_codon:yes gene_type:complete